MYVPRDARPPAPSSRRHVAPLAMTLSLLSLLGVFGPYGCSSTSSATGAGIGPAGGTVTASDGATVTIPPGALSTMTAITMAPASVSALPGGGVTGGTAYLMGPEGQEFLLPVTVTLIVSPSALPAGTQAAGLTILTAPADVTDYAFALVPTVVDATHVSVQTFHFSNLWEAATNTPGAGQRLTTTGAQGGAGGATAVCFTTVPACTSSPPPDICAGVGDACACDHCGASTIPCCDGSSCSQGRCAGPTSTDDAGTPDAAAADPCATAGTWQIDCPQAIVCGTCGSQAPEGAFTFTFPSAYGCDPAQSGTCVDTVDNLNYSWDVTTCTLTASQPETGLCIPTIDVGEVFTFTTPGLIQDNYCSNDNGSCTLCPKANHCTMKL